MKRNIGLVGYGSHGSEVVVPALCSIPGVRIAALCDISPTARERFLQKFPGTPTFVEVLDDAFWTGCDLVVACASPQAHEAVVEQSFKHRKPCFVEKPLAVDTPALRSLATTDSAWCNQVRVGHNFRYSVGGAQFIDSVRQARHVDTIVLRYFAGPPRGGRWGLDKCRAFFLTHVVHVADFVHALLGDGIAIHSALLQQSSNHQVFNLNALVSRRDGTSVSLTVSNAAAQFSFGGYAIADHMTLTLDRLDRFQRSHAGRKRHGEFYDSSENRKPARAESGYVQELTDFIYSVQEGSDTHCRLPNLVEALNALDLTIELMRNDGTVQPDVRRQIA